MSRTENEAGYADGYRVGPNGTDPDGNPSGGYSEELFGRPDYRAGLSEGRTDRIDDHLRAVDAGFFRWPGTESEA